MNTLPKAHEFLREKYLEKKARNISYSLRSFANSIGISSGGISRMLSGDLKISTDRAKEISERLRFSQLERDVFLTLVEAEAADLDQRQNLFAKAYSKIAIWKRDQSITRELPSFYSIDSLFFLNLIKIGVQPESPVELSQLLKKSETFSKELVESLIEKNWIVGTWGSFEVKSQAHLMDFDAHPSLRQHIYQRLLLACSTHLERYSKNERSIGFETFALDETLWPEVEKITYSYLDQLAELSLRSKNPNLIVHSIASAFIAHKKTPTGDLK